MGVFPEYEEEMLTERSDVNVLDDVKAYSEIPGPKELPIIGNAWRFAPIIGTHSLSIINNRIYLFVKKCYVSKISPQT